MEAGIERHKRESWYKISMTCEKALRHGYDYAWVDTCCIDKSSSAELSEAINSMFLWYQNAEECFVYLADYPHDNLIEEELAKCRWLTRGWTLQELIAPEDLYFYNSRWSNIAWKRDLGMPDVLSRLTLIPKEVLLGGVDSLSEFSAAQKMSWAARRQTTRIEDAAYCLLGLFDINMPLLYGERHKAFARLQGEILTMSGDLTLLAWNPTDYSQPDSFCSVFAQHPSAFRDSGCIQNVENPRKHPSSMTAWGIMSNVFIYVTSELPEIEYGLYAGMMPGLKPAVVPVSMEGPNVYSRVQNRGLVNFERNVVDQRHLKATGDITTYLATNNTQLKDKRMIRLHLVLGPGLQLLGAFPKNLWHDIDKYSFGDFDHPFRVFTFVADIGRYKREPMLLVLSSIKEEFQSLEGCHIIMFEPECFPTQATILMSLSHKDALHEGNFRLEFPEMADLGPEWIVRRNNHADGVVVRASESQQDNDGYLSLTIEPIDTLVERYP